MHTRRASCNGADAGRVQGGVVPYATTKNCADISTHSHGLEFIYEGGFEGTASCSVHLTYQKRYLQLPHAARGPEIAAAIRVKPEGWAHHGIPELVGALAS